MGFRWLYYSTNLAGLQEGSDESMRKAALNRGRLFVQTLWGICNSYRGTVRWIQLSFLSSFLMICSSALSKREEAALYLEAKLSVLALTASVKMLASPS